MTTEVTEGIQITVKSFYRPEFSNPLKNHFLYTYKITIENNSNETVQLMSRHWFIFDSNADRYEVEGEGVIGFQPILSPGDIHEYESSCELTSEMGNMHGAYTMQRQIDDSLFDVKVPKFEMIAPMKLN
ncbi:MAG: Co2+/Mg2+ efflux protein ApaG [Flavobacteriales bacterium]|nr:Co2+/Mg2+ efflux protein ApaG [Flavobacteriales bacterium]MBT6745689.1 Co2+/Mg2+ efflux protein ApaG [Flavobacteriales bacterium]